MRRWIMGRIVIRSKTLAGRDEWGVASLVCLFLEVFIGIPGV